MRPQNLAISLPLVVTFGCFLLTMSAKGSLIPQIPDTIPEALRSTLIEKRAGLQSRLDALNQRTDKFNVACNSVDEHSSKAEQCRQEQASIRNEKTALVGAIDKFKQTLGGASHMATLDKQIAEMEKQLRGLTFKRAVPDFAWFAGQSEQAQAHMVSQLISRVRDYAIGKSEAAMQQHFLDYIRTMKPKQINKLADFLRSKGAAEPLFQEWLRSFSPKASRVVLVQGSKLAIDAVKKDENLFKISEDMEKGTVQDKQDAALTVLIMVADYPGLKELQEIKGLKELKAIGTSGYDVGEAWATIYFLDQNIEQLSAATNAQLTNQKEIIKRMKELVDERQRERKKLAKL